MEQRVRRSLVVLLSVVGVLGVVIGELLAPENSTWKTIATFGGSALFGASLPMILEEFFGTETRDIWHYLTANEKFDSAPDYIPRVAIDWHVYYLTKEDGQRVWKYVRYELRPKHAGRSIGGGFTVSDGDGKQHEYRIEGGIRGSNLVLVFRSLDSSEDDAVEVVPDITNSSLKRHVGLQMLKTWDNESAISLSLYAREPLLDNFSGTEADFAKLDTLLETSMRGKIISLAPQSLTWSADS